MGIVPKRRKRKKIDRRILILFSITPVACLFAIITGLLVAWYLFPTRFVNANISEMAQDETEKVIIMIAADFAEYQDINRAKEALSQLKVPNPPQYVALIAERLIRTNRGEVDIEIKNVVRLADALGVSTVSMIAYVSTATATPTITPLPTDTPTNTPVIPPTPSPTNTPVVAEEPPTSTAVPPTETSTAAPVVPTNTPLPTDTPEPTVTPTPSVDFIVTKQRLLTKAENGGCLGMHSIFVTVVDINGNQLKGVQLGDIWGNPGPITGHKGDDKPGIGVFDLYKNAFVIEVKNDPSAGRAVTTEQSGLLSSNDWEIGIPRLIEAGYCADEASCRRDWNSGIFGEGANSLCWGHYSWEVTFQRTW